MQYALTTRALRAFAVLAAVSLIGACDDSDPVENEEPTTTRIVLTIGTGTGVQTITWNTQNATVTGAIAIPAGQSRTVTAQFFRADNSADPVINDSDFRLDFTRASGTAVTITKTGNLAATLTAAANTAGQQITFTMELIHLEEGHPEYESNAVTVTVTN